MMTLIGQGNEYCFVCMCHRFYRLLGQALLHAYAYPE